MSFGSPWSEKFIDQISEKEIRDAFVADQVRSRIAQLIRILREQEERKWNQSELAERSGKTQSVISRLENPDAAQPSIQTLLEICSAFDLPLWVDFPDWETWLTNSADFPSSKTRRYSFDGHRLKLLAALSRSSRAAATSIHNLNKNISEQGDTSAGGVRLPFNDNGFSAAVTCM